MTALWAMVTPYSCAVWDASSMCLHGKARPPDHLVPCSDYWALLRGHVWNRKGKYQRVTIDLTDHLGPGALFHSKILEKHFSSVCHFYGC